MDGSASDEADLPIDRDRHVDETARGPIQPEQLSCSRVAQSRRRPSAQHDRPQFRISVGSVSGNEVNPALQRPPLPTAEPVIDRGRFDSGSYCLAAGYDTRLDGHKAPERP